MSSVVAWFADRGVTITPRTFPTSTHTAQQAADSLGVEVGCIAKSVLFVKTSPSLESREGLGVSYGAILVIASGANRIDENNLSQKVGEPIRKADKHEVKTITGYEIGGIPPIALTPPSLGSREGLGVSYFDPALLNYSTIWASAGTPNSVFSIDPQVLQTTITAILL